MLSHRSLKNSTGTELAAREEAASATGKQEIAEVTHTDRIRYVCADLADCPCRELRELLERTITDLDLLREEAAAAKAGRETAEKRATSAEEAAVDWAAQAGKATRAARAHARAAQPLPTPLPQPRQAVAPAAAPQPSVAVFQEEIIEMEVHGAPDQAPEQVSSAAASNAYLHGRLQYISMTQFADLVLLMARLVARSVGTRVSCFRQLWYHALHWRISV